MNKRTYVVTYRGTFKSIEVEATGVTNPINNDQYILFYDESGTVAYFLIDTITGYYVKGCAKDQLPTA